MVTTEQIAEAIRIAAPQSKISDKAIDDIVKMCNRYMQDGKRPLYVYCCQQGTKCAMTAKALFNKRIEQCEGDIVCLMTTYKSRGCKVEKPAKVSKPKAIKTKAIVSKTDTSTLLDPVDQPDPFRMYKILLNGEWVYWWNDPKYQEEWRQSRDNPKQLSLQDWINMLKKTCHRVDISCSGPCNNCPLVMLCSCPCKTIVDTNGKKLAIDPINRTTFDISKTNIDPQQTKPGSLQYFNGLISQQ